MGRKKKRKVSIRQRAPICGHLCYAIKRGNCPACNAVLYRQIKSGETTDEELVEAGLMLPSQRGRWPDDLKNPTTVRVGKVLVAHRANKKRKP